MDKGSLSHKIAPFGCFFAGVVVLTGAYTRLGDVELGQSEGAT